MWSNFSLQRQTPSEDGVIGDRRGTSGAPHPGGKHESSAWPTIENERRRHSPCRGRLKERGVSSVLMKTFHAILGCMEVDHWVLPIRWMGLTHCRNIKDLAHEDLALSNLWAAILNIGLLNGRVKPCGHPSGEMKTRYVGIDWMKNRIFKGVGEKIHVIFTPFEILLILSRHHDAIYFLFQGFESKFFLKGTERERWKGRKFKIILEKKKKISRF